MDVLRKLLNKAKSSDHLYEEQAAALDFARKYGDALLDVLEKAETHLHSAPESCDKDALMEAICRLKIMSRD